MDAKTTFEVTKKAGGWVAGRRSPGEGKTMLLTEAEAHYALAAGELVRPAEATSGEPAETAAPAKIRKGKADDSVADSAGA